MKKAVLILVILFCGAAGGAAAQTQVGSTIGQLAVANIHLMRSQLHPQGAIYTTIWTLSLAQKEGEP